MGIEQKIKGRISSSVYEEKIKILKAFGIKKDYDFNKVYEKHFEKSDFSNGSISVLDKKKDGTIREYMLIPGKKIDGLCKVKIKTKEEFRGTTVYIVSLLEQIK